MNTGETGGVAMKGVFDEERFADWLDRAGADLARWPAAVRAAAERLLETSPSARETLRAANLVDAGLDAVLAAPPVPLGLKTRILAHAAGPRQGGWRWLPGRVWLVGCAPLAVGLALGLALGAAGDAPAHWQAPRLAAFSSVDLADFELPERHAANVGAQTGAQTGPGTGPGTGLGTGLGTGMGTGEAP